MVRMMKRGLLLAHGIFFIWGGSALADDVSDLRVDWRTCVANSAYLFATKTNEPADMIAAGSFGSCEKQMIAFLDALHAKHDSTDTSRYEAMAKSTEDAERNSVIAEVLRARAGQ